MNHQRCIVVSLDGLVASALSCYGSSWNHTPAVDTLAADGTLWDRVIVRSSDPLAQLKNWFTEDFGTEKWQTAWRANGPIELFSDNVEVTSADWTQDFDVNHVFEPAPFSPDDPPATEVEDCRLTDLVAGLLDRMKQDDDWSLLWLHSGALLECWDAPRDLFPLDEIDDQDDEPSEDVELIESPSDADPSPIDSVLPIFPTLVPPSLGLNGTEHPDLVTSWMRTYGAQIQLIDILLGVIHDAAQRSDAAVILVGTRGFPLGQQDKIGVTDQALVSADLHVPMIIAPANPARYPHLVSDQVLPRTLCRLASQVPNAEILTSKEWVGTAACAARPIVSTDPNSGATSVTTNEWFLTIGQDNQPKLFLKPDDANDYNNVNRLEPGIVDELKAFAQTDEADKSGTRV